MKVVPVYEAEGMVLCHDITQIIPGKFKGRAFKKGHVVQKEDIPKLLDIGKEHLYVWEVNEKLLHENDGVSRIAKAAAGVEIMLTEPNQGKVEFKARSNGLLKINTKGLEKLNNVDEIVLATLHSNQLVQAGQIVAGCRIVPLVIEAAKVEKAEKVCRFSHPLVEVRPLKPAKVGIVTTGSEVYHGRIKDQFGPVLRNKFQELGSEVLRQIFVTDSTAMIVEAINTLLEEGADLITITGGMSVDPDDLTPAGIREAGGEIVIYGAPTLPGSMFMLAYLGQVPILGLPGCVMYHATTIFDLVITRILAGEKLQRQDILQLGHGGLCMNCEECRYPNCAFGKGS